jgi:3'-5' exoribonuclease
MTIQDLAQALSVGQEALAVSFTCQVVQVRSLRARNGNPYLEIELADGTACQKLRIWHDQRAYTLCEGLKPGQFVCLEGALRKTPWGVTVDDLSLRSLTEEETAALLEGPADKRAVLEQTFQWVLEAIGAVSDPRLRILGLAFLEQYGERFRRAPAAREYHHAYRGGLLEHVAQMLRAAEALEPAYPWLNWDLVRLGILFHDSGKLWELDCGERTLLPNPTRLGELVGHIPMGIELVNRLWRDLSQTPEFLLPSSPPAEDVRQHLLHLIASHHGQKEFGSPVTPKTPEGWVLHYLDNLDAKLAMLRMAYERAHPDEHGLYERRPPLEGRPVEPLPRYRPTKG